MTNQSQGNETPIVQPIVEVFALPEPTATIELTDILKPRIVGMVLMVANKGGELTLDEVKKENSPSISRFVMRELDLSRMQWSLGRMAAESNGLLTFVKPKPESRTYKAIRLTQENEANARALAEARELPESEVLLKALNKMHTLKKDTTEPAHLSPSQSPPNPGQVRKRATPTSRSRRVGTRTTTPEQEQRLSEDLDKTMRLSFRVGKEKFFKDIKVRSYIQLMPEVRLLIAFGQINEPSYSFLNTSEKRWRHAKKLLYKDVNLDDMPDDTEMNELIRECTEIGWLETKEQRTSLTALGMNYIKSKNISEARRSRDEEEDDE